MLTNDLQSSVSVGKSSTTCPPEQQVRRRAARPRRSRRPGRPEFREGEQAEIRFGGYSGTKEGRKWYSSTISKHFQEKIILLEHFPAFFDLRFRVVRISKPFSAKGKIRRLRCSSPMVTTFDEDVMAEYFTEEWGRVRERRRDVAFAQEVAPAETTLKGSTGNSSSTSFSTLIRNFLIINMNPSVWFDPEEFARIFAVLSSNAGSSLLIGRAFVIRLRVITPPGRPSKTYKKVFPGYLKEMT